MPRLNVYRRKRHPGRTPEPFGAVRAGPAYGPWGFVIQQHSARRMHWDFRLEIEGVLVSWAVPRGPAVDPKEKRLAVLTEDHPMEYGKFEGLIPAGNYGAGAVILWDRGTYECVDGVAPSEGLARGKLDLELHGFKLRGRWALVRTKRGNGKEWLLFKKADGTPTTPEPVQARPESVLSGLTVEQLREGMRRDAELAAAAASAGAPHRPLAAKDLSPMLADTADAAFSRDGWIFELKYDGYRALAVRDGGGAVKLLSRNKRDLSPAFPEIAYAAAHLPCADFVLDGEIIAVDERGTGSFERLQQRVGLTGAAAERGAIEHPVVLQCFDLLAVAGHDVRALPLVARKDLLRRLVPPLGSVRYADHIERDGTALYGAAEELRLEGIIAKRADSAYSVGRRSPHWLKIKIPHTVDLAIVGYMPGKGSRSALGSLMLAGQSEDGLVYAGNVGSGLSGSLVDALLAQLRPATRETPAFRDPAGAVPRGAVYVEPQLVAEVRYTEVTSAGLLRQPIFHRLRGDKTIAECDTLSPRPISTNRTSTAPKVPSPAPRNPHQPAALHLTNLDKVFWPDDGYTKGDLLAYYRAIWPTLAPYLRDRPVMLTRYPDGIAGKSFFQRNAPEFVPDWVPTCRIEDTEFFLLNELDVLLYVINLGCIPLHLWSARHGSLEHPDWTILDLDPKGAPFADVITVARHIHRLLDALGAPHFIKTSGQAGMHILLPLAATLTHEEAKQLAEVLARVVAAELPAIATIARPLGERGGKVYVDFLQNGFGKTIAGPFSARPQPGAPVSTPLEWREVTARLDPKRFTIKTVPPRFSGKGDPMLPVLGDSVDVHALLLALGERVASKATRKTRLHRK